MMASNASKLRKQVMICIYVCMYVCMYLLINLWFFDQTVKVRWKIGDKIGQNLCEKCL